MSYGDEILRIPTLILEGLPGYVYSLFNNALANQHLNRHLHKLPGTRNYLWQYVMLAFVFFECLKERTAVTSHQLTVNEFTVQVLGGDGMMKAHVSIGSPPQES